MRSHLTHGPVHDAGWWLRMAFALGATTDALALVPLLHPTASRLLWGLDLSGPVASFAARAAAALMLGWTLLLVWALRSPLERRAVAPLTLAVVAGLVLAEIGALIDGAVPFTRMVPNWVVQSLLLAVFARASLVRASRGE